MGLRERFQSAVVISPTAPLAAAAQPALNAVAKKVFEVRSCGEAEQVLLGGSTLLLTELQQPALEQLWRRLCVDGNSGSVLVTVGPVDAARITALVLIGPVIHVPEPINTARLEEHLARLFGKHVTLASLAQSIVGQGSLTIATRILREGMFLEAMQRTLGNRMAAAELLQIDRRAVQRMAKQLELPARFVPAGSRVFPSDVSQN